MKKSFKHYKVYDYTIGFNQRQILVKFHPTTIKSPTCYYSKAANSASPTYNYNSPVITEAIQPPFLISINVLLVSLVHHSKTPESVDQVLFIIDYHQHVKFRSPTYNYNSPVITEAIQPPFLISINVLLVSLVHHSKTPESVDQVLFIIDYHQHAKFR